MGLPRLLFSIFLQILLSWLSSDTAAATVNRTIYIGSTNKPLRTPDGSRARPYSSILEAYNSFWRLIPSLNSYDVITLKLFPDQIFGVANNILTFDSTFGRKIIFTTDRDDAADMLGLPAQVQISGVGSLGFEGIKTTFNDVDLLVSEFPEDSPSKGHAFIKISSSEVEIFNLSLIDEEIKGIDKLFEITECPSILIKYLKILGLSLGNYKSLFFISNQKTLLNFWLSNSIVKNCNFYNYSRFLELSINGDSTSGVNSINIQEGYFSKIILNENSNFFHLFINSDVSLENITMSNNWFLDNEIVSKGYLLYFRKEQKKRKEEIAPMKNNFSLYSNFFEANKGTEPISIKWTNDFGFAFFDNNKFKFNEFKVTFVAVKSSNFIFFKNSIIENNRGLGDLINIYSTKALIITNISIFNLNCSNIFGIFFVSKLLSIEKIWASNSIDFRHSINGESINIYQIIGGSFKIVDSEITSIQHLFFSNIDFINTGAINLNFENSLLKGEKGIAISMLSNIIFFNNTLNSIPETVSLIFVRALSSNYELKLDNFSFYNNTLITAPGYHLSAACLLIDALMSKVSINRHLYEANSASKQKACIKIFVDTLNLNQSIFRGNYITDLQFISPLDSINCLTAKIIIINQNIFLNNTSGLQGVLSFEECKEAVIIMTQSIFVLNSAQEAGAVNFGASSFFVFIDIFNCRFSNNLAETSAGAILFCPYSVYQNIRIQQTIFGENEALGKGGAIHFADSRAGIRASWKKPEQNLATILINGSYFDNNTATDGSCIYLVLTDAMLSIVNSNFTSPDPERTSGSLISKTFSESKAFSKTDIEQYELTISVIKCVFFTIGPFKDEPYEDFAVIKLYRTQVQIISTEFTNINFTYTVGIIVLFHCSGIINGVIIKDSGSSPNYIHTAHDNCITSNYAVPTGLMIVGDSKFKNRGFWIINSKFLNISSINSQGASITSANFSEGIGVMNCVFESNKALEGAGFYSVESKRIFVFDCLFKENEVRSDKDIGGALSFQYSEYIEISFSTFIDNNAGFGGAISFNKIDYLASKNLINFSNVHDCSFFSRKMDKVKTNFFFISFGDFFYHLCNISNYINDANNTVKANKTYMFGVSCDFSKSPKFTLDFQLKTAPEPLVSEFMNLEFLLSYKLYDGKTRTLFKSNNSLRIHRDIYSSYKVIAIKSENTAFAKDPFDSSFEDVEDDRSLIILSLNKCKRGEFFNNSFCIPCPSGTYSIDMVSQECKQCPLGATCGGVSNLTPRAGYWRSSKYSENILDCGENSDNCLGGLASNCSVGYSGPLCMACSIDGKQKFMLSKMRFCSKCAEEETNEAIMITIIILIGFYQCYYIFAMYRLNKIFSDPQRNSISMQARLDRRRSAMFIKVLTLYLQILSIVQSIDIGTSRVIKEAFSIIGSPSNSIVFSYNCWIVQHLEEWKSYYVYLNFIFVNMVVLAKYLLIGLIWCLLRYVFRRKIGKRVLIVAFLSLTYLEQPGMLSQLFSFLSCRSVDGVYYLKSDANFECYTDQHFSFIKLLVIPAMMYWVFLYPGISLMLLFFYRNELELRDTKIMLGSLYQDFKIKFFFWEFVQMLFKLMLIILNDFIIEDIKTKGLTFIFVILIYLYLHDYFLPYADEFNEFNDVIAYCNRFFIASIFFAVYSVGNQSQALDIISKILFYSVNLIFFILVLAGFFVVFKSKLKRLMSSLLECYHRYKIVAFFFSHFPYKISFDFRLRGTPESDTNENLIESLEPSENIKITSSGEETKGESPFSTAYKTTAEY